MKVLVSIVIPTYQRAEKLIFAINSVKKQTLTSWEIIVVDDNSPNSSHAAKTSKVMANFNDEDNIYYIPHRTNLGACAARNTGVKAANGKYIAFLDDDDLWFNDKLEKQVNILEKTGNALCYSDISLEYQGRKKYFKCIDSDNLFIDLLKQGYGICTSALLIRKDVLDEIHGFDNSLPSMQDYDLLLRIVERFNASYLPEALLTYQLANDGISCNPKNKADGHRNIIRKYKCKYIELGLLAGLSRQFESLADFELRCQHRLLAIKYYFVALFYKPLNFRVFIKLFFGSLLGKKPLELYLKTRQYKTSTKVEKNEV